MSAEEFVPDPIIVGYTSEARNDLWDFAGIPVPGNMTKPETIEKWRREKLPQESEHYEKNKAPYLKLLGLVSSVYAVDLHRGLVFDSRLADSDPAASFVTWLLNQRSDAFPAYQRSGPRGVAIYGLDASAFVKVSGLQAAVAGASVPVSYWQRNDDCFDPYDMLVETGNRKNLSLNAVLRIAEINVKDGHYEPHKDAQTDAHVTAELLKRFGLLAGQTGEVSVPLPELQETTTAE